MVRYGSPRASTASETRRRNSSRATIESTDGTFDSDLFQCREVTVAGTISEELNTEFFFTGIDNEAGTAFGAFILNPLQTLDPLASQVRAVLLFFIFDVVEPTPPAGTLTDIAFGSIEVPGSALESLLVTQVGANTVSVSPLTIDAVALCRFGLNLFHNSPLGIKPHNSLRRAFVDLVHGTLSHHFHNQTR